MEIKEPDLYWLITYNNTITISVKSGKYESIYQILSNKNEDKKLGLPEYVWKLKDIVIGNCCCINYQLKQRQKEIIKEG